VWAHNKVTAQPLSAELMHDCACQFDFARPIAAWQPVVKVRRGTEAGDTPGWQGARRENMAYI
jgi:hypothetical protein